MAGHEEDDKNVSDAPLEPWEIREARIMMRNERRVKWFWATIRIWAYYAGGAASGFYIFQDSIVKLFKRVFG